MKVDLEEYEFDDSTPTPTQILLQTHYSAISPGTELALLTNDQDIGHWQGEPYPSHPGYAAVGRVIACGTQVEGLIPGDTVFAPCGHAAYHRMDTAQTPVVKVPDAVEPADAVYVRFCAVSMTTLRTTRARAGDGVAVFGLGLIGAMAAQVFQASGYEVIGVDPEPSRRDRARACGLRLALAPEDIDDGWPTALAATPCALALDTSGSLAAIRSAIAIANTGAEIVLVGVPWKSGTALGASELLQAVFTKYLHLRSGWEWEIPTLPASFAPGSVLQNMRHAMDLLARGQISAAPLRSHLVPPGQAEAVYKGLLHDKENYHSAVFDWTETV
jgi:2-desacetyl-2-hydroxyethyl bacteriochlorophyllide A dehydrogenase